MRSNSTKIKTIRFLLVIIPIIVVCYFFVWQNVLQRREAEVGKNFVIAQSSADFIEHEVTERLQTMKNLAQVPEIQAFNVKHIQQAIQVMHLGEDEVLFVTDSQGKLIAYTPDKPPVNIKLSNHQGFKQAIAGRVAISKQEKSLFSDNYVIFLFVPIFNGTQQVCGVIVNELPVSFFKESIGQIKLGKTGHLSLVDSQGYYIYDHKTTLHNSLTPAQCFNDCKGKNRLTMEKPCQDTNEQTLYAMVRLQRFDWYLIASQKSYEVNTPGVNLLTKNILTLLLLIFSLIVLWRFKVNLEYRDSLVKQQNAEKLALVGELAAGMAHEIRNPLTTIKGFSDLLKQKNIYKEDREILELVSDSVEHIDSIVRETLLLAKPQKRKLEPVNLTEVAEDTFKLMEHQAFLKNINFQFDKGVTPLSVEGDAIHLKQVLVNLVKNALDASEQSGSILVRISPTDNQTVKIAVEDKGVGIPDDVLDKIGMPFVTTKDHGTGLGLSVCRRIVDEHNGAMRIYSRPGKGTIVEIELPLLG